jgi:hypothetical protein
VVEGLDFHLHIGHNAFVKLELFLVWEHYLKLFFSYNLDIQKLQVLTEELVYNQGLYTQHETSLYRYYNQPFHLSLVFNKYIHFLFKLQQGVLQFKLAKDLIVLLVFQV